MMNYINFKAGANEYQLRLTTRSLIAMEKNLGCNPIQIFMEVDKGLLPKMTDMAVILHSMLQPLHHGITLDKTYDIIDEWLEENDNMFELIQIFMDVFQAAGFINTKEQGEPAPEEVQDPN